MLTDKSKLYSPRLETIEGSFSSSESNFCCSLKLKLVYKKLFQLIGVLSMYCILFDWFIYFYKYE